MKTNKRNAGFTLIEIMLVVVIIGILAAMVIPRLAGRTEQARVAAARSDIEANIGSALDLYELDNGSYPTTEQGLLALIEKPSTEPIPLNWKEKGYLEKARIPKDPWGKEYIYLSPGVHDDFDIISYGADGAQGGEGKNKDINSWEIE